MRLLMSSFTLCICCILSFSSSSLCFSLWFEMKELPGSTSRFTSCATTEEKSLMRPVEPSVWLLTLAYASTRMARKMLKRMKKTMKR